MHVRVTMTADHIAAGKKNRCRECPVAIAVKDCTPECVDVEAGDRYIAVAVGPAATLASGYFPSSVRRGQLRADTPPAVGKFIWDFDAGYPVDPISFDLDFEPADPTA